MTGEKKKKKAYLIGKTPKGLKPIQIDELTPPLLPQRGKKEKPFML